MREMILRSVLMTAAASLVAHGLAGIAVAGIPAPAVVPEIGPGSITAGLAILAGGALMLRSRRR